jgi:peptidylprolyl isomerase
MKIKMMGIIGILLLAGVLIIGCGKETAAPVIDKTQITKDGDRVTVHYTGTLSDGTVFDSSRERDPLQFVLGAGIMISGFEDAVRGMYLGEKKTVTLTPEEAYGPHREDLVIFVSREELPPGTQLEIGQKIQVQTDEGVVTIAPVIEMTDEGITVDANHPLAGKELTFEIELIKIEHPE